MIDLLSLMGPDDDDPDAQEDFAAATGTIKETAVEEFHGGYNETPEALAARLSDRATTPTGKAATTRVSRGLGDVILTLPREDKDELLARIHEARARLGLTSSGEVVLRAMRAWSMQTRVDRDK